MEDKDILQLWKQYDTKLEEALVLNQKNTLAITQLKVQSLLSSMKPLKIFTILAGIAWVGFIDILIIKLFPLAGPFFLVSAIIQVLLTKLAIGIYLYQFILLHQADISEPVLATQDKLARLQSSTLWVARLLFLQLPVWTTFHLSATMFQKGDMLYIIVNGLVILLFTCMAVWLFVNIKYENRNRKWFRLLFDGNEWSPVIKSMELLRQVSIYKAEPDIAD